MEVHHIKPLDEGGSNEFINLKTVCRTCHVAIEREKRTVHKVNGQSDWEKAIANGRVTF